MVRGRSVRDETVDILTQLPESSNRASSRLGAKLAAYFGRFADLAKFMLSTWGNPALGRRTGLVSVLHM